MMTWNILEKQRKAGPDDCENDAGKAEYGLGSKLWKDVNLLHFSFSIDLTHMTVSHCTLF